MCLDQVGQEPGVQLNTFGWTSLTGAHQYFRALYGLNQCLFHTFIPERSDGLATQALTVYQAGTIVCPQ